MSRSKAAHDSFAYQAASREKRSEDLALEEYSRSTREPESPDTF